MTLRETYRRDRTHPFGVVALVCLLTASPAFAQLQSKQQEQCIVGMNKVAARLAAAQSKENLGCFGRALKGKLAAGQSFIDCLNEDARGKLAKMAIKVSTTEQKRCSGTKPSFGYTSALKINASLPVQVKELVSDVFADPVEEAIAIGSGNSSIAKCQLSVAKAYERFVAARLKQFNLCKGDGLKEETITSADMLETCLVADPADKVARARQRIEDTLVARCQGVDLGEAFPGDCRTHKASMVAFASCIASRADCRSCVAVNEMDGLLHSCDLQDDGMVNSSCRSCGNGFVEPPEVCDTGGESATCDFDCTAVQCGDGTVNQLAGEQCDDGNAVNGDGCDADCSISACGNGVLAPGEECDDGNTEAGDGCSDGCTCEPGSTASGCPDPQCPLVMELTVHAGTGGACTTNTDCAAGVCDGSTGRCRTQTGDDIGYTGIVHDVDTNDGVATTFELACGGPAPLCGQCLVRGLDASSGNCRCADDSSKVCNEPFLADADDCAGAVCECFDGPPAPAVQAGFPVCLVWKHASDVSGTVNVDTGQISLDENLRTLVFLGESTMAPCPYCTGDLVAGDGARDGTCVAGPNDGLPCDAAAFNQTFPAPGGDGHSLDCMPSPARNISNEGVVLRARFVTEPVALLASVPCGPASAPALCPCGVCLSNPSLGCASDADCGNAAPCVAVGEDVPANNQCSDGLCLDDGGGDGVCASGPIQTYCDGMLRADGEPFISCVGNADCATVDCGNGGCGNCSITRQRECFPDPIVADGLADPFVPRLVATSCMPQANPGLNQINGLPGPARLVREVTAAYRCPQAPGVEYVPGVGGCP